MTHQACRERLVDLLYGELSPREARVVEEHLAACEACRAERDGLAAARTAMRQLPAPSPPERGDAPLLAAARRAAEEQQEESFAGALRRFSGRLALGTGLAAIAAYVLVTWSPGRGPAEIAPPPPVASDA
ncbi:MAG TPA: zf-HC2 domain-containing protein, partial [Anaeromyxobacteraceae bacterium]|nr:zf-HC2 domain-containing protein [Anaeromyxobacteraceae bacterium]